MPKPAKKASAAMTAELVQQPPKFAMSPLGLEIREQLTLGEWRQIGSHIGVAMKSAAFVIGDWLVYGEGRDCQLTFWPDFPEADRVRSGLYEDAIALTGLDVPTLQRYAYVARNVPRPLRNEHVSWEHHKRVAKLREPAEQKRWLTVAAEKCLAGHPLPLRRFARSIQAGRLLTLEELEHAAADTGIENVHPYVNRIVAFFARLRESGWLANADEHKRAALKRDLQPIIDIHNEL